MDKHEETIPGPDDFRPHSQVAKPESLLSRRDFIRRTVQIAVAGALIPAGMAQILPAIAPDALSGGGAGPVIRRENGQKIPITIEDLAGEPPVVVTAEWSFLPAVVYKVKKTILESSARRRGYNTGQYAIQHPTESDHAIMVYKGKCKHLGCTVGFNAGLGGSKDVDDYNGDGVPDGRILCPCHQGQYDIHDLALNVPGTPPPTPLDVVRFNIGTFTDPEGQIPSAPNTIIGYEFVEQNGPRAANKDPNKAFALGSLAPGGA